MSSADAQALQDAVEDCGLGTWRLSATGTFAPSAACARILGFDPAVPATLADFLDTIEPEHRERVRGAIAEALAAADGGRFAEEFELRRAGGRVAWVRATGHVAYGTSADGRGPAGLVGALRDISADRNALGASGGKLQTLIEAVPHLIWSAGPDGRLDYMSPRIMEDLGVTPQEALGDAWIGVVHPDDQARTVARWTLALAEGKPQYVEHRIRTRGGIYRWYVSRAVPVRNAAGCVIKWIGTTTNTHELKLAEEKLELLARELSHRIKNIFALVNGLISLCARRRPEAGSFAADLRERIASLARAHDYVRPQIPSSEREPAQQTLHGLLREVLVPYLVEGEERIRISGDDEVIGVTAATALALVVHEMATNAVKYGALSLEDGRVGLALARVDDTVTMAWHEQGGPPVPAAPGSEGFGTVLMTRTVTGQLGGRIEQSWEAAGLRLTITMLASHLKR